MITRVWFEKDALHLDGLEAQPARSLVTAIDGDRVHILTLSGLRLAQLVYGEYGRKDGTGFASAAAVKAYLDTEFAKGPALTVVSAPSARTLGTAFRPNVDKPVFAAYTVRTAVTNPLLVGASTATVTLLSDTANPPTTERARVSAESSVGVAVAIQITTANTATLSYIVPPGHYVRLVSTTTGTGQASIVSQTEEVLS